AGDRFGERPSDVVGRKLLDFLPGLAVGGVFEAYREACETGLGWRRDAARETLLAAGKPRSALVSRSAVPLGTGLLVSWQVPPAGRGHLRVRAAPVTGTPVAVFALVEDLTDLRSRLETAVRSERAAPIRRVAHGRPS